MLSSEGGVRFVKQSTAPIWSSDLNNGSPLSSSRHPIAVLYPYLLRFRSVQELETPGVTVTHETLALQRVYFVVQCHLYTPIPPRLPLDVTAPTS